MLYLVTGESLLSGFTTSGNMGRSSSNGVAIFAHWPAAADYSEMIGKDCEQAVSTRRPAAMSTRRRKWPRKSTLMGNCTSANRKVQAKRRLLKMRFVLHSPQHGMDWQL
jgi:hypothetical protein